MSQIRIVGPDEGERLDVLGAPMIIKADGTDFPLFLAEHPVPPGYFVPPHLHENDSEILYILEGELTLTTPAGEVVATAGSCVRLPHGIPHGFRNATDRTVRLLVIALPGLQAVAMFRHFDRAGRAAPLTPETLVGICAQYGVRMG